MKLSLMKYVVGGIKLANRVIEAVEGTLHQRVIATPSQSPAEHAKKTSNPAKKQIYVRKTTNITQTIIKNDNNFLKNVIEQTEQNLSVLILDSRNEILKELRRQEVKRAMYEVQARIVEMRKLISSKEIKPGLAKQLIKGALHPLQVSLQNAEFVLKDNKANDIYDLCYLSGTSVVIAAYGFLGQDMPSLREELQNSILSMQHNLLDQIAKKMFSKSEAEFP